jgi:Tol biopolymer transport system component
MHRTLVPAILLIGTVSTVSTVRAETVMTVATVPMVDTVKTVLPLAATRSAKFTTTKGTWMSVDVSPDGQKIIFDLLGDLYTLPIAGGKATRITSGIAYDAQPRWSPDGRQITFISDRTGGDNVWLAAGDGSNARPLTNGNFSSYVSPEWMPDGKYVVASRSPVAFGVPKLWMYDVEGGNGVARARLDPRRSTALR